MSNKTYKTINLDSPEELNSLSKKQKKKFAKRQRLEAYKKGEIVSHSLPPLGEVIRNIKLEVEYDGTLFNGWQIQEGLRTIQEEIEKAIVKVTGEKARLKGASRTDKGVHAEGQVAIFSTKTLLMDTEVIHALNSRLPDDIVIRDAITVSADFNPRADAKSKLYEYRIRHNCLRPAIRRNYLWYVKQRLNMNRMTEAASHFVGVEYDFSSFTPTNPSQGRPINHVCLIDKLEIIQEDTENIRIEVIGKRFLYKMVRNIVGTLVDVGLSNLDPESIPNIIMKKSRISAGQGAPPQGLTLKWIKYTS